MARDLSKILIIDLEATCWSDNSNPPNNEKSEIIEIGSVLLDLKSKEIIKKKSILVIPEFSRVSSFCTELTTITDDLLNREGVSFPDAMTILKQEFKPSDITWASYGDYDRVQMDRNCDLYRVKNPLGRTHLNVKNLFAIQNGLSKEIGMGQALQKLGIKLEGTHHRGLDDAINISKILVNCLK